MAITALDIKDKQFTTKFRGYNEQEVDEFLDIIVDDYEDLVRDNRELAARVKELEEKLAYFDEMKESLSQSVILAQETAEKVKASAADESANLINKANFNATHLVEFFVMQQMKPNVLPSKRKNLNVKVVSSTNAYWLQLKVSLAWQVLQNGVNCCNQQLFIFKIQMLPLKKLLKKFWMNMYLIQMMQLHLMQLVNSLLMKWLNFNVVLLKVINKLKISLVQKLMKQTKLFQLQLILVFQTLSRVK